MVPDVSDAVCVGVNHQHRLMTVGCRSGVAKAFVVEESTGCLKLNHQFLLRHEDLPPEWMSSFAQGGMGKSDDDELLLLL